MRKEFSVIVKDWKKVFKSRLIQVGECLEYTGFIHHTGYGQMQIDGKNRLTHRIAWEIAFGKIGKKHVLHKCDNKKCCNTEHLFLGTNTDNIRDRQNKKRQAKGESAPHSRLKAFEVLEIRQHLAIGKRICKIALAYGVSACAVSNILHRKTWKHI